jgi:hypothetical protein
MNTRTLTLSTALLFGLALAATLAFACQRQTKGEDTQRISSTELTQTTVISPTDTVWEMLGQVNLDRALEDLRQLSGEEPMCAGTYCYTIANRLTSTEGLQWATDYVSRELVSLGYAVEVQNWSRSGYTDRNVIARKTGVYSPTEEIYFVAHVDGVKPTAEERFPAADDDASGVVDNLELARILSRHTFSRTVVLLFTTGEEQGRLGARSYLDQLSPAELSSIKYAVNVDMVGYDGNGDGVMELWHGGHTPSMALTQMMSDTIRAYQLDLAPGFVVGCGWGDEVPFREKGIATALQIQSYQSERNPSYHTTQDNIAHMNLGYWLEQMKATTAIAAHLAVPMKFESVYLPFIGTTPPSHEMSISGVQTRMGYCVRNELHN